MCFSSSYNSYENMPQLMFQFEKNGTSKENAAYLSAMHTQPNTYLMLNIASRLRSFSYIHKFNVSFNTLLIHSIAYLPGAHQPKYRAFSSFTCDGYSDVSAQHQEPVFSRSKQTVFNYFLWWFCQLPCAAKSNGRPKRHTNQIEVCWLNARIDLL